MNSPNTTPIPNVAPHLPQWQRELARTLLDAVAVVRTIDPRDIDRWERLKLADAEAQMAHQIDHRKLQADADPESPKKRQRTAGPCGTCSSKKVKVNKCPTALTTDCSPTFQQCERLKDNQSLCQRCRHAGLTRCPPHLKWEPRTRKEKVFRKDRLFKIRRQFTDIQT